MINFAYNVPGTSGSRAVMLHRWCWRFGVAACLVLLGCALVGGRLARDELAASQMRLSARLAPASSPQVQDAGSEVSADFVQHLPIAASSERLMAVVERARQDHGMTLTRVQVDPRPLEAGQLNTTDLSLSLKAPYPAIKAMLADLMARCPEITLVRLSLQNPNGAPQSDGQVSLRAWARGTALDANTSVPNPSTSGAP